MIKPCRIMVLDAQGLLECHPDHYALEAWERMTYGGVLVSRTLENLPPHRDWGHDQIGVSHGYFLSHFRFASHLRGCLVTR